MKIDNVIQQKSFAFALRIVHLYRYLTEEKKEFVLAKQILRSGTSIGANIEEAIGAQSQKDFLSKISIAYKQLRIRNYELRQVKSFIMKEDNIIQQRSFAFALRIVHLYRYLTKNK